MKANIKNQNGAISLFVLISMMFFLAFMLGAFTLVNSRNASQIEALSQLQKVYASKPQANDIYDAMFAENNSVIPITNLELLKKAKEVYDTNTEYNCFIDGKIYTYKKGATYVLKNDITIPLSEYTDKQDLIDNEYLAYIKNASRYKINTDGYTIYYEKQDKTLAKLDRILFNKAKDIAEYNANIGKAVNYEKSYTTPTGTSQAWEILYADDTNVYIISNQGLNSAKLNEAAEPNSQYSGTNDFQDSIKLKNYPAVEDGWFEKVYYDGSVIYTSNNINMKETEYILDSTNIKWSGLKNSYAKWVIGGPTMELLVASYNEIYTNDQKTIANLNSSDTGYAMTINYGLIDDNIKPWNHGFSYWLASPASSNDDCVNYVKHDSNRVSNPQQPNQTMQFRPVVCLKSDVTLKWNITDNKYDLILDKEYELAEDISKNSSNIGKAVNYGKSYTTASGPKSDWEILYADNDNVYIITTGNLTAEALNINGYNGTSDFTNLNTTKYPAIADGWLYKVYNNGQTIYNSNKPNMKATEYLLDSANSRWSELKNNHAKWVIGAPTMEMMLASYNTVNSNNPLSLGSLQENGYEQVFTNGTLPNTNNAGVAYNPWNHGNRYWVAAPANGNENTVRYLRPGNQAIEYSEYTNNYEIRPVVCLKSDTKFVWNGATNRYDILDETEYLTSKGIAANPENIGKKINYGVSYADASVSSGQPDSGWQIFHADDNYVYIIPVGHLALSNLRAPVANGSGYNGTSDFATLDTTKYQAVADGWLYKVYNNGTVLYNSGDNPNMKAAEYLLDSTVSTWSGLKNNKARWVIGGPTMELIVASYNLVNPSNTITIDNLAGNGYDQTISANGSLINDANRPWNHGKDYWLACPARNNNEYLRYVLVSNGTAGNSTYARGLSFRPIVCLKSDNKYVWNGTAFDILD